MLDVKLILERRYEIERELKESVFIRERLNKELEYLDGLLELNRNSKDYSGYETRGSIVNVEELEEAGEYTRNLQGVKPSKSKAYKGEVFRYTKKGEFISKYNNPEEARDCIAVEEELATGLAKEKNTMSYRTIEYACTGTHNLTGTGNHHTYKGSVWFDRKLSEEEIEICKVKKIFK